MELPIRQCYVQLSQELTISRTGLPATRQVGSVQRAIAVLDALAEGGAELGTNEIARRTGINASSISRLLSTLTDARPGAAPARHRPLPARRTDPATGQRRAGESRPARGGPSAARGAWPRLSGETVTLSLPGEHDVLTVDFVQSSRSVRSVAEIGRNSVAHATATGKVFLACGGHLPDGDLPAFTDVTITDRRASGGHDQVEIAAQGYAAGRAGTRQRPQRRGGTRCSIEQVSS
ncbi:MAG: helix-turn-helix domain-containing protein [Geodermatophilaceae bacterium]